MSRLVLLLRPLRRFARDRRGLAYVEFALAAPFVLAITLATVDLGLAMWTGTTLKQVANDASRYAAIRGAEKPAPATQTEIINYARSRIAGLNTDSVQINVTWNPNNTSGSTVTVTLGTDFDFIAAGFLPLDPIRIERSATMTIG